MERMEIEWPVRRTALVVDNDELDHSLGVPYGMKPLAVPGARLSWRQPWPEFVRQAPCWISASVVREVERGTIPAPWQRPEQPEYKHINGRPVLLDGFGRPLNLRGRNGRNVATGQYWYPGPNWAADAAAVTQRAGRWWILLVRRLDNKKLAVPGGMCDWGERPVITAGRELTEETGFRPAPGEIWRPVYTGQVGGGYAFAWTETGLYVCEVHPDRMREALEPQASEVIDVAWHRLDQVRDEELHGGHDDLLRRIREHVGLY